MSKVEIEPLPTKSIRMPAEIADKWLEALRSGEYRQCDGALSNRNQSAFCCLGVLEMVVSGEIEKDNIIGSDGHLISYPKGLPSTEWLNDKDITFHNLTENNLDNLDNPVVGMYSGYLTYAATLNDSFNMNFAQIADIIEPCIERI